MKKFNFRQFSKRALSPAGIDHDPTHNTDDIPTCMADYQGLTSDEVNERIKIGAVNGDQGIKTKSIASILRSNILTPFNIVLISFAVLLIGFIDFNAEGIGNFGFVILVVVNSLAGIVQETRAKRTIDKLSIISAPKVYVKRDGVETEIKLSEIVMDDLLMLSTGNQICADAVITAGSIEVNESLITGEPDIITKNVGDAIMSGSFVVSGDAEAQVYHVGLDNFATKITAGAKYFKKPTSAITRSLMFVVKIMTIIITPLGVALFCVKYLLQNGVLDDTVITTIGTLINMIPSGLVALATAVFCISVIRLSKHKTLAQDLYCVETLARVDVLCLDKTGTITEGSMEVSGIESVSGDIDELRVCMADILNVLSDENATADAMRDYTMDIVSTATSNVVVPFSSARKWSGAEIDGISYVVGAPEFVLEMTDELSAQINQKASEGLRVLVVAKSEHKFADKELPSELSAIGFVYLTDKIRKEAPDTLKFFAEQDVAVKIISGDNPTTVRAVAMRAGLSNCDNIIDMSTLKTEQEVIDAAEKYTIFGRVLPAQKLLLVKALKSAGHTVAMTGDGVNDVLALKEADCSIAMASGSDAAKNVSSLILLDSNFASMPKVVAEGRRSINNLERSASLFLVKTFYLVLISILFMIASAELPFEPRQMTLVGGVTIGIPSFILALEPNNNRVEGIFLIKVLKHSLPGSLMVFAGIVAVLLCDTYFVDMTTDQASQMYMIMTVFVGFIFLIKVSRPFFKPLKPLHFIVVAGVILIFALVYAVPIVTLQKLFGAEPNILTADMAYAMLAIGAVMIPLFAITVLGFNRLNDKVFLPQVEKQIANGKLKFLQ